MFVRREQEPQVQKLHTLMPERLQQQQVTTEVQLTNCSDN